jgi:hypothetical protein
MNIQLKPMKLIISRNNDTWDKVVTDLNGNVIFEQRGLKLFPEHINKQYFDEWETQLKGIPCWNIVEVERFI